MLTRSLVTFATLALLGVSAVAQDIPAKLLRFRFRKGLHL